MLSMTVSANPPTVSQRAERSGSGVLILDKPAGVTSHDVVNRVRRRTGCRRVGHAGTLDPMATGVLVVCVGAATRLIEYLQTDPKVYEAVVAFGMETDTQDITGAVIRRSDARHLTDEMIEERLQRFRGPIMQLPPMVSAVHVGGKRLYELARRGIEIERQPREVTVHSLTLLSFEPGPAPTARLRVECSSGTYVRTLAADLGRSLGCGAALAELRRTRAGRFGIEEACNPDGPIGLIPIEEALDTMPKVRIGPETFAPLRDGQGIDVPPDSMPPESEPILAYSAAGDYAVVVRKGTMLRPVKVLGTTEKAG